MGIWKLPEGVRVTRITTGKDFKGEDDISFHTNDLNVSFNINTSTSGHFIENANTYVHNGITYYIEQRNSVLVAGAIYNGYLYSVSSLSKESLFLIIMLLATQTQIQVHRTINPKSN